MPDFEIEDSLNCMVAGVDEAGRGPWAGPVVAGAVIIRDRNLGDELLKGLDDSKKLSEKKRYLVVKTRHHQFYLPPLILPALTS